MILIVPLLSFSAYLIILSNRDAFDRKNGQAPFFFIALPIFLFGFFYVGLRPLDAGFDTPNYVKTYLALEGILTARETGIAQYGNTEFLWWPIQSLFKPFLGAREWLVFNYTITFITTFFSYRVICKNSPISPWIFALAFLSYYLVYSGNTIRQAIAIPFATIAFFLFFDRKFLVATLTAFFAIGLHWSSIFVLLGPIMKLTPLRKKVVLLALPVLALASSAFFIDLTGWGIRHLGIPELQVKYDLYFSGLRDSHIGPVWKTLNFWICTLVPFLFLSLYKPANHECTRIHAYTSFLLSFILAGINTPDFSERFFPAMLFIMPLITALTLREIKPPRVISNIALLFGFFLLGLLTLMTGSAQKTLGYTFYALH